MAGREVVGIPCSRDFRACWGLLQTREDTEHRDRDHTYLRHGAESPQITANWSAVILSQTPGSKEMPQSDCRMTEWLPVCRFRDQLMLPACAELPATTTHGQAETQCGTVRLNVCRETESPVAHTRNYGRD